MAKVSATASMGVKLKIFKDEFENASTMASITIEKEVPEASDEELLEHANELYSKARTYVSKKIQSDIDTKYGKRG